MLEIGLPEPVRVAVGALGLRHFPAGTLFYVGSAQKGLRQRVRRHLGRRGRAFWHIDSLLAARGAEVRRVHALEAEKAAECRLARSLAEAAEPVHGFGSSDCSCPAHLLAAPDNGLEAGQRLRRLGLIVLELAPGRRVC